MGNQEPFECSVLRGGASCKVFVQVEASVLLNLQNQQVPGDDDFPVPDFKFFITTYQAYVL